MNILLVDDHLLVRKGVVRLLSSIQDARIHEAGSALDALALFRRHAPDIVVLDISLGGSSGLELLKRLVAQEPGVKVLMLSMHTEAVYAARALRAGAKGYISKGASADDLIEAVTCVARGGRFIESAIASSLAVKMAAGDGDLLDQLSLRETEILRMLGEGKSIGEIAESLGAAYKTIANTCSIMKSKLAVERTSDLIRMAIELRHT
jgi:DNA-binding NarL/FixJ family response regulator